MNISIIGSGNVASHLAPALKKAGHRIINIYSRNSSHAKQLAKKVKAKAVRKEAESIAGSDCVIIAVNDDSIKDIVKKLPLSDGIILHTSGTEPLAILKKKFKNCGVLYPVQTFSKNAPSPKKIFFCIEASNPASLKKTISLAKSVPGQVQVMNSEERKVVHLAAVISNNFSNHLFAIAEEILKEKKLDFRIVLPLIEETVRKIHDQSPARVQTGPATRGDAKTIMAHLALLGKNKMYRTIYRTISASIVRSGN